MKKKVMLTGISVILIAGIFLAGYKLFASKAKPVKSDNEVSVKRDKDYKNAEGYIEKGQYIEALNILEGITQKDDKINNKIQEAAKRYIEQNIEASNKYIKDKKYNEALDSLNLIPEFYSKESAFIGTDNSLTGLVKDAENKSNLLQKSLKLNKSYPVSILMYHSISSHKGNNLCVPPEKFKEEMKFLKDSSYNVINLDDLYWYYTNDIPVPIRTAVITIDDGYEDNYTNAYPILKELGLKATIFVITSTIDTNSAYINSKQIKELDENNIHIESHTTTHEKNKELGLLSYAEQFQYLKESKETLEKILGRTINHICYPSGSFNSDTIKAVQIIGYKTGVTMKEGRAQKNDGIFTLNRIYASNKYDLKAFKKLLKY